MSDLRRPHQDVQGRDPHGAHGAHDGHDAHAASETPIDSEIDVRRIGWFLVWLAVGSIVTCVLMYALYRDFQHREERADRPGSPLVDRSQPHLPPEPRLQVTAELDLKKYRDEQQTIMQSYGWVDQALGVVHIPIDRAMDLVAAQHLPWRPHAAAAPTLPGGIPAASVGATSAGVQPAGTVPAAPHPTPPTAPDTHSGGHR